jgi:hypothetical protein
MDNGALTTAIYISTRRPPRARHPSRRQRRTIPNPHSQDYNIDLLIEKRVKLPGVVALDSGRCSTSSATSVAGPGTNVAAADFGRIFFRQVTAPARSVRRAPVVLRRADEENSPLATLATRSHHRRHHGARLDSRGAANFRDIGDTGPPTDATCARDWVSSNHVNLTARDYETLNALGIKLVCDFRPTGAPASADAVAGDRRLK